MLKCALVCELVSALLGAFLSFLVAVGLAFEGDEFGVMGEPIDQRDDAGGVGYA